jgi:biotin transport system substrate-specific component
MAKMAICVALCCVTAYISFPLPFTPGMVTALTIAMNLTAFLMTPKQTLVVLLVWCLLGCVGVPVFVGGTAGFGRLLGPTGGFIIAFLVAYPIVSLCKGRHNSFGRYLLVAVAIGIPITYIGGLISMLLLMQVNLWQALIMAVFPYIPGDIIKAAFAAFLGVKLNKVLAQQE